VRTCERDHDGGEREQQQRRLRDQARAAARREPGGAGERTSGPASRALREHDERDQDRCDQQEGEELGAREAERAEVHGVLRKTTVARTISSTSSAAPPTRNGSDASLLSMNPRVPTRAFS